MEIKKSNHTPGPWKTHAEKNKIGILTDSNVDHIATIHGGWNALHKESNARLIAAAPELFESTKKLVALLSMQKYLNDAEVTILSRAKSAILKAEGGK